MTVFLNFNDPLSAQIVHLGHFAEKVRICDLSEWRIYVSKNTHKVAQIWR